MKHPVFIFSIVFAILLTFFYLYPADIFEVQLVDNGIPFNKEITIKQLLRPDLLVGSIQNDGFESCVPTLKGWFMLFAIFIGLPIMIAYRFTLKRYPRRSNK